MDKMAIEQYGDRPRYIDADMLLKDISESVVFSVRGSNSPELRGARKIIDRIENAPTADVEEVKYGEWIDKWDGKYANPTYVCSNCGEKALLENYINELNQWRYRQSLSICCPHCGAEMGGRSEA